MVHCEHGNRAPELVILNLPAPCESRAGRQKCAVCAYAAGIDDGLHGHVPAKSEQCAKQHAYAPLEMLKALPRTQVQPHRHRCVYLAYQEGKSEGQSRARFQEAKTINEALLSEEAEVRRIFASGNITSTQKEQLVLARRGQGVFRQNVRAVGAACRLTGTADDHLLIASHIKPWRVCSDVERLDGYNGLLLAPHVDHLFDRGWISFDEDGEMILSPGLRPTLLQEWGLPTDSHICDFERAHLPYLNYHRATIFKK